MVDASVAGPPSVVGDSSPAGAKGAMGCVGPSQAPRVWHSWGRSQVESRAHLCLWGGRGPSQAGKPPSCPHCTSPRRWPSSPPQCPQPTTSQGPWGHTHPHTQLPSIGPEPPLPPGVVAGLHTRGLLRINPGRHSCLTAAPVPEHRLTASRCPAGTSISGSLEFLVGCRA